MKKHLPIIIFILCLFASCKTQQVSTSEEQLQFVRKQLPFAVSDIKQIRPNTYLFHCDKKISILPDYEIDTDGATQIYRTTFEQKSTQQSDDLVWRNVYISKRYKQVLCIDRLLQDGKTFGYVYLIQSEDGPYAAGNAMHWDVSDHRLMQSVAPILDDCMSLSVSMLKVLQSK